jgi:hypothetical protein
MASRIFCSARGEAPAARAWRDTARRIAGMESATAGHERVQHPRRGDERAAEALSVERTWLPSVCVDRDIRRDIASNA